MTVLTAVTVSAPFPSGVVVANLGGKKLVAVYVASTDVNAQLAINAQVGASGYRPLYAASPGGGYAPVVIPLRGGAYMQVPDNLGNLPDDLQLVVSGLNAAANITLLTL